MKATVYTLGCKVNSCDSGTIIETLRSYGISADENGDEADIFIVNTCAVTAESERKSRNLIRKLKHAHPEAFVIACGCWSRANGKKNVPSTEADLILNTVAPKETAQRIIDFIENKTEYEIASPCGDDVFSAYSDTKTRASLKIQDGCNRFCSYCLIPYLRGKLKSDPPENIIKTINHLCGEGFKEAVLTGIHIASYKYEGVDLTELISMIGKNTSLERLRLGSLEPSVIDMRFLNALAEVGSFCPHFHLSLQSGSDSVLERMQRRYTTAQYSQKCDMIRKVFPLACITTDIIVGFPGETEEEFAQTEAFVKKIKFSHVHVFPYSKREGTKAFSFEGQLSNAVKHERALALISVAEEVSQSVRQGFIGSQFKVLSEYTDETGMNEGYSENYLRIKFRASEKCINTVSTVLVTDEREGFLYGIKIN